MHILFDQPERYNKALVRGERVSEFVVGAVVGIFNIDYHNHSVRGNNLMKGALISGVVVIFTKKKI